MDVLANDSGQPLPATLQILSPPAAGTATISNGKILYTHSGSSAAPVTFTYRVSNVSGTPATGTVTIHFATQLRLTNAALAMPEAPPSSSWQMVDAFPGLTFTRPISLTPVPGDTKQLYVCEQGGVIRRVADVTASTPTTTVFLDLASLGGGFNIGPLLAGQPENGLLGLAFHPNYSTNGYFYVAYTVNLSGNYFQRVSRFTRSAVDATIANPASELILLQIDDFGLNHNGGDLHFGPNDGYLYYGTGDGENSTAGQARSQKINDDFYPASSGWMSTRSPEAFRPVLMPPSPPTAAWPDSMCRRITRSFTPASAARGMASTMASITPARWARCGRSSGLPASATAGACPFDPVTGELWEGDVGQNTYEEVNKIVKGGNYGWAYREGLHPFSGILGTEPAGFTSINPVYEYLHDVSGGDAAYKGNSVVGGFRLPRHALPALVGSYIFSDSVSGHVWQMVSTGATTRLTGLPGAYGVISTQGVDPFNKDLLFAAYLSGKIMRLSTGGSSSDGFPPR